MIEREGSTISVFGICMVRNAEDIIGTVVSHMMEQVDHVIVADNLSTDGTRDILDAFHGNITVMDDLEPAYRQSEKTTHLAMIARKRGADYVVPFDADEVWCAREGTLKSALESSGADIVSAPIINYVPTSIDWPGIDNPVERIKWRFKDIGHLRKVACKTSDRLTIAMGNHSASYTDRQPTYDDHGIITVRHFPWRTPEQFVEKAVVGTAALEMTDLPYDSGQHWREYARIAEESGTDTLRQVFFDHFYSSNPYKDDSLTYDPVEVSNAW